MIDSHAIALGAGIGLTATAHLLLKSGASGRAYRAALIHWRTLAGLMVFGLVTVLNVYALQQIPMNVFVAWSAAAYVLVVIGSAAILREGLGPAKLAASGLIVAGILLFSLAS